MVIRDDWGIGSDWGNWLLGVEEISNLVGVAWTVMVFDNVTIGEDTIIGAGAVVSKDIPPFSIAAGVPARVAKSRK